MNTQASWSREYSIETSASAEAIWSLFRDVSGWKHWNAGIESIELDGPFADGTWFTMKPPGQDAFRSQLINVRQNEGFIDETRMGDLVVQVAHRIQPAGSGRTRIVYSVQASGTDAPEVGAAISSDFPDVLAALAARAEQRPS